MFCNFSFELRLGIFCFIFQHLVIKFVIGLRQVGDFLQVLLFPPRPIKTDRLDITIHHSSSHSPIRCGSRHLPKGGGAFFFRKTKSDFKTICFKINQKIPRRNSKLKLQNMVKREMTRTSLKIFWFLFVCLFFFFIFTSLYLRKTNKQPKTRIFSSSSLSSLFLPCFVILALNYASVSFDLS
jgi:hypothetical protein